MESYTASVGELKNICYIEVSISETDQNCAVANDKLPGRIFISYRIRETEKARWR